MTSRHGHPARAGRRGLMVGLVLMAGLLTGAACRADDSRPAAGDGAGAPTPAEPRALKVCEDPDNMPFSNARHEGIENRIADLFGRQLGVPVEYFDLAQRMNFVRNSLRFKLPGEDYRCDLMISVPVGFAQVATTRPYYRSTYAVVYPKGGPFDGVNSGLAFIERLKSSERPLKVGVFDKSPATRWLEVHGLSDRGVMFRMMSPDPAEVPGRIIDDALLNGAIDAAVAWGPIAAFHARKVSDRRPMQVVPLKSEGPIRFDYAVAMGVRHGEPDWKARVQSMIDSQKGAIEKVLREFDVPLVDPKDATPDREDD